jgi:hypothetical protein
MELRIEIQPRKTYLYVLVSGIFEINKAKELFEDAVEAADKHGLSNILVDYREIKGGASTIEKHEYSEFGANLLQKRIIQKKFPLLRLAYVGKEPFFDPTGFGETIAVNRGAIVLDTDKIEEAMEWLQANGAG